MYHVPLPENHAGRLAFGPRPRTPEEVKGFDLVLCLLTDDEIAELDLHWLNPLRLPIPDRACPPDRARLALCIDEVLHCLSQGGSVLVHCRAGIGRAAMITACILAHLGVHQQIWPLLAQVRGVSVPDTEEQIAWVARYIQELTAPPDWDSAWAAVMSETQHR